MSGPHVLITRFYEAFARRDWAVMGACYQPDVHFTFLQNKVRAQAADGLAKFQPS